MTFPKVLMYSTQRCPYCVRAEQLFTRKGVSVEKVLIDVDTAAQETMMARSGGRRSVPQIFIGDTHVGGCDDLYALEQAGKLDELLKL